MSSRSSPQKHRVAMVLASAFPSTGGTAAAVKEMSEALACFGHEVHIVVYDHGMRNVRLNPAVMVHRAPRLPLGKHLKAGPSLRKPFWDIMLTWRLLQVVLKYKIEIIHTHNYEAPIAGYIVRALTGVPVIYHAHNTMSSELHTYYDDNPYVQKLVKRLAHFLDKWVPRKADFVIAITSKIRAHLVQHGVPSERIVCVPLGVDLTPFIAAQQRDTVSKKYDLDGRLKIVYTGILDEFQEVDKLIAAFRKVLEELPESKLILAGQFVSPKYYSMCEQFGALSNVLFIKDPTFSDTIDIIAEADVAVVPRTICPGIPYKLLNYMASGKPIVVFEGSAEGVRHMENGLVIKNGDIDAFAKGIVLLLRDRLLAQRLGDRARQTVQKEYSWPQIIEQISEIYDLVLKK